MDRTVWWTFGGIGSIGLEEKMPASADAQFWCRKVGAVNVNVKYHAAATKVHSGIWTGGGIVEELGEVVMIFCVPSV